MSNVGRFRSKVLTGNWFEDGVLEKEAINLFMTKMARGEFSFQKRDLLKQHIYERVQLSGTKDGLLHFGDSVVLVNTGGLNRHCTNVSINADITNMTEVPHLHIQPPCGVSAGRVVPPCVRTVFTITRVDDSPEGSRLAFDQSFTLRTTCGFANGLYLTSDAVTLHKNANKARLQEVYLDGDNFFEAWWKIVYINPLERLEYEGEPVPVGAKVLIVHCKTNRALGVVGEQPVWTTYGKEYELTAHSFFDSHKIESENNHWVVCTTAYEETEPPVCECN